MITIIIVNYRTPDDLCRLLESIHRNPPREPWETIVVDNASGDDSVERVRRLFPETRLVTPDRNRGFAAGVNHGLTNARGDTFLILNPDIIVKSGSIDALKAFLDENPQAGLAAARLLNEDGTLQYTCRTFYTLKTILLRRTFLGRLFPNSRSIRDHLMLDYDHRSPRQVDWVAGACMMVRRDALEEVGPMDERYFMYFEDVDWCTRMQRRGWGVWYVPDAEMVHGYRRASAGFGRAARMHAGSLIRFWEKWSALVYLVRRHRQGLKTTVFVLADLVAINAGFLIAYYVRSLVAHLFEKPLFEFSIYATFLVATNIVALSSFFLTGLYRDRDRGDWIDTLFGVGKALLVTCLVLFASSFILRVEYARAYSRLIILSFWPLALAAVTLERRLVYNLLALARRRRINVRRVALIGSDARTDDLARLLREDPLHGYEPVRINLPPAERPEALRATLEDERISDLVLSTEMLARYPENPRRLIESLREARITIHFAGPLNDVLTREARVAELAGQRLLTMSGATPGAPGGAARRLFDAAVAAGLVLVYLFPALLTWALLVAASRAPRVVSNRWTADGWGGGWLKRTSLDRYPALGGVLVGRTPLVSRPGRGPGLFGPEAGGEPGLASDGLVETDLKRILRDILERMGGDRGSAAETPTPVIKRSHRSALR